ncbi:MAG TPA: [FeFe] hydrogenase H-cluster maturation GTPase HydF, partial [Cyanobacteria bacterium UBA9971]|nr:[FeFe] hydrogenase H-cluster maturation GTPase HydF [Cyanobacteria bacterium UBA9971]
IDVAIIVCDNPDWGSFEQGLYEEFKSRNIPIITVFNKIDLYSDAPCHCEEGYKPDAAIYVSAKENIGIKELKEKIINSAPEEFLNAPSIAADLIPAGELAILVVPIDLEAPKGRLILPQVQTIRDLLDNDSIVMVVKERELKEAL